ncbi:MAG: dihydrofolate reductase [Lachnospiraceae bacterium]|nr:dihydrofolate reductase [Ruminococcus sp.]MCM1275414.1 dihydrofolate reductase [Lachnospiraceae bacterium]
MTLILVMDNDCAIGRDGGLLCSLPADMKNFRAATLNSTVIMGRKTYESFPKRPLPDRENLVLSRSVKELDGARVFADVGSLLEYVKTPKSKVFVIGGGEVYAQLAPYCTEALITRVYESFGGDVFFEDIEHDPAWELAEASPVIETGCKKIRFLRFVRKTAKK